MSLPSPLAPQLPESQLKALSHWLEEEDAIELAIVNSSLSDIPSGHWTIEKCLLDRIRIVSDWSKTFLQDCKFNSCDISNANWSDNSWQRVIILESKLTGLKLNDAVLEDVRFVDCKAEYLQLQNCRTKRVVFERCDLSQAYFNNAKLQNVLFDHCNLTGVDFSGVDLSGSDLRGSIIEDIKIEPTQLRNVTVTADQALYLTGLIGLKIEM